MKEYKSEILFYGFHLLLGYLISLNGLIVFPFFAIFILIGTIWVLQTKDSNFQVLKVILYVVGAEVLFRMRSDGALYDLGKYTIIYFCFLGYYFKKVSMNSWPYLLILILFIPSILLTFNTFFIDFDVRRKIMFNILGPLSLLTCSVYTKDKKISINELLTSLKFATGPLLSILILVILFTPTNLMESITSTSSNFQTSGGFGPNQMSVVLGLGAFLFFVFLIFEKNNYKLKIIYLIFALMFFYRSLLTFSRGGLITALLMVSITLVILYYFVNKKAKLKIGLILLVSTIIGLGIWGYTNIKTEGMIEKRYGNKDAAGRVKESILTGREHIMDYDVELFKENPVLGVGIGMSSAYRESDGLSNLQAHSEPTRLLAEHGVLGLLILLILIFTPIYSFFKNRNYYYIFFIPFLLFWLLTINHAATRIVAPGVIYSLTLLILYFPVENRITNEEEKDSLPR